MTPAAVALPTGNVAGAVADGGASHLHWSALPPIEPGADAPLTDLTRNWSLQARLQHLDAWWDMLQGLSHFNPEYVYDPAREYTEDWTTDPDYRLDGVRVYHYDREGFLSQEADCHFPFINLSHVTLVSPLPRSLCREGDLFFKEAHGIAAGC